MPRCLLMLLLCAVLAFPAPLARGQATDFQTALSGEKYPLTLKMKDLDGSWRRVSLGTSSGAVDPNPYYTRGDMDQVAGETFLVAYHRQTQMDLQALMSQMKAELQSLSQSGDDVPKAPKVTPKMSELTADSSLSLCLLNVRTLSSLSDIQPFLPNQKAANLLSPHPAGQDGADPFAVVNLKRLGMAITAYWQEHDDKLPPMQSAAIAQQALYPYLKSDAVFQQPQTHEPYLPNSAVSGLYVTNFDSPAEVMAYYEASPGADGTRAVLFLNGQAERIPEIRWSALKAASYLPSPPPTTKAVP